VIYSGRRSTGIVWAWRNPVIALMPVQFGPVLSRGDGALMQRPGNWYARSQLQIVTVDGLSVVFLTVAVLLGLATGREITVQAAIVNRLDQQIRVANVPVYLGQVSYAQQGLQYSQAYINRGLAGQTPVEALTNADGIASFTINSPVGGSAPVYLEANFVNQASLYPYGYSPILTVRFGS
jgi:hypothetical protein